MTFLATHALALAHAPISACAQRGSVVACAYASALCDFGGDFGAKREIDD